MMTARGPLVLEFNARFGDPETQPILMRLDSDLLDAFEAVIDIKVDSLEMRWSSQASIGVVMASAGYPEAFEAGKIIRGIDAAEQLGAKVFHAGTALRDDDVVTSGGRVLCVTALGTELIAAAANAYEAVQQISFEGAYYRRDIGKRAMTAS
jgi:phosphoribosylamine--glycine ligase